MTTQDSVLEVLMKIKALGKRYRELTGKPIGITGEVAEYEAARILNLDLTQARQVGYDATEILDGKIRRIQIKSRCLAQKYKAGQRVGAINTEKEWDSVLLVLLDENFEVFEIYEAERHQIISKISAPGSRARNERHALGVSQFKSIGRLRWKSKPG